MRYFALIALSLLTVTFLTAPGLAQNKFKNEDTAKNRQDNAFGTPVNEKSATTTFTTNEAGDTVIRAEPTPEKEPVDWYDKIIIAVDPDVSWPTSSTTTSTTSSSATDTSGGTSSSSSTTTTTTE